MRFAWAFDLRFATTGSWIGLLGFILSACVGEASVVYRGTVTVAPGEAGYDFDPEPNPGGLPPISDAHVLLCADCDASPHSQSAAAAGDGTWGPLEQVFGGFVGSDTTIRVEARAEGMETFVYQVTYEDTQDPTGGEKYLNLRLKRSSPGGAT